MDDRGEIQRVLGEMNTHIQHIRKQVDAVDNKVQNINDQGIRHEMKIESAHKRLDEIAPLVSGHQKIIDKGQGMLKLGAIILSGIGFITGFLGSFLGKLFGSS